MMQFLNQYFKLIANFVLGVLLIITPAVWAGYKPPNDQKTASDHVRTNSAGTRGSCNPENREEISPTLLASEYYVGKTLSTHPTFAWFIGNSQTLPVRFILYHFDTEDQLLEVKRVDLESTQGIMKLSPFTNNDPGLEVEKQYLWQIAIFCQPGSPSSAIFKRASFEIVETPVQLSEQLALAQDSTKKSELYGVAGFWYDALAEALQLAPDSKLGELGANLVQELAASESEVEEIERLEKLKKIANEWEF